MIRQGALASLAMGAPTHRPKEAGRGPRCPELEEALGRDARLIRSWDAWVHCPALQRGAVGGNWDIQFP